ncbi:beta-1,6-N-acetylglucosaminyltransferase [Cognatishimia activa]|uniref:Peptide O-xylosyltransferase n=1 Tax=Cognatishimia activa TaxID=1715691 RepID=A0A975I9L6_9RHOB|nr:beta-1,6-N-acetylglucosaminyltransferase [Cognatishimia activa]QTN37031.1 glycosyl transferase [Cognatishimia activa]
MSIGVLLLVHTAFDRAEQVARLWSEAGCPVVIHVDAKVSEQDFKTFEGALADRPDVRFCARHTCVWGMWGLVAATQSAAEMMLAEFEDVERIYLSSGSCLPLRPIKELQAYLDARPATDFIESAAIADAPWAVSGLEEERFTLYFPFSWQHQRWRFDRFVDLQRRFKVKRKVPEKLVPHMGSQWWCLTRKTLTAILQDPNRAQYDRFFKSVWIPDESYFQTMVRLHSKRIESRSLTLSKFDFQGKPHVFYDDHLQLLRRSDCFVARKIWPKAERLYQTFPNGRGEGDNTADPNPSMINRLSAKSTERRNTGRDGLYMQSRFPDPHFESGVTAAPYSVFQGFSDLFEDFESWLALNTGCKVHGHLFAHERVEFEGRVAAYKGALSDSARLRDYNPRSFLTNLIWNTRGERQCFQFGPQDNQANNWLIAKDPNAQISVISGAWAAPLFKSGRDIDVVRRKAALLQKREAEFLKVLQSPWVKAKIRIWTMSEFLEAPVEPLQIIVDEIGTYPQNRLTWLPTMTDLTGFGKFVQALKNAGMHPHLLGDFPVDPQQPTSQTPSRRPYLVQ